VAVRAYGTDEVPAVEALDVLHRTVLPVHVHRPNRGTLSGTGKRERLWEDGMCRHTHRHRFLRVQTRRATRPLTLKPMPHGHSNHYNHYLHCERNRHEKREGRYQGYGTGVLLPYCCG
jgi:hypothetical protein